MPRRIHPAVRFAAALALLLPLFGCSKGGSLPPLHAVRGQILQGGRPVGDGLVRFHPEPDPGNLTVNSVVGPDGRFELITVSGDSGGQRSPGAPAGTYRVTFYPDRKDQSGTRPVHLPQTFQVKAGNNNIPIELPEAWK